MNGGLRSLCLRVILAAALPFSVAASAHAGDGCPLRPPDPVLRPGAYPGQTLSRPDSHATAETARLGPGLRIEIRQDSCVDDVTTAFTLAATRGPDRLDEDWIALARAEIGKLKLRGPRRFEELDAFLGKARRIAPRGGERTLCRDGSAPDAGGCSWDSLGGYTVSVKRRHGRITVSVTETISA